MYRAPFPRRIVLFVALFAVAFGMQRGFAPFVVAEETTKDAANEEGFTSLFDGKTLGGWQGDIKGYKVEEGAIVCHGGNLYTDQKYANFAFRFEFKLPPGGNNGVGIRTPNEGDAAYNGMEIQVLDDDADDYKSILPYQHHGSIYGVVPAETGHLKKAGEWNEEEIVADGTQITVTLNGHKIVDADIAKYRDGGTPDGKPHPGLKNKSGHICFCGHGAPVAFRNVRIKQLPE